MIKTTVDYSVLESNQPVIFSEITKNIQSMGRCQLASDIQNKADDRGISEIPSLLKNAPSSWPSHTISKSSGNISVADAVVLCGGRGSRMHSLTHENQKCLLPLAGIPMIDYTIRSLVAVGCDRIFFVLGHRGDLVKRFVGDGKSYGISPVFIDGPFNGTLHGTVSCLSAISRPFFYLHANVIYPIRLLRSLWRRYSETKEPQVAIVSTPKRITHMRVRTQHDGTVSKMDTTGQFGPAFGDLFLGVALYDKMLFSEFDGYTGPEMTEVAIKRVVSNGGRVWALPYKGRWRHYETEEEYIADVNCTPVQLVGR